ncbi:MAG: IS66 family insertion sequence element accessory protein TnpB [Rhodoferax sp.]|uniref:IS66 family insertion sequence element accessory protein TnpB n=1 Tax=Rhodoferax sp. TaxID=50421 RepID=UPI0027308BF9|nr:IS66 family insertion sequence element accessory protein TnpB [Rhodoferax sp.]MDP1530776.1 IS66 family insertion sequence element accessory protein TnpB [Rhodoferax sp.]MDP1942400.1 IS66 family insertion sequence element accessory protein TnpB [Rhodoferax sp.]
MIRIDAVWLSTAPLDMRAGTDTALARVVAVFGCAHPHTAYLFANRRANRMKVLVHDGIGIWLAARRLHQGHFVWPAQATQTQISLSRAGRIRRITPTAGRLPYAYPKRTPKKTPNRSIGRLGIGA